MKNSNFAKNLQAAREVKYRIKKDFADALGIPASTYGQYENGQREPNFVLLVKIADKLDVSLDQLLRNPTDYAYRQNQAPRKIEISKDVKDFIQEEIHNSLKKAVSMI